MRIVLVGPARERSRLRAEIVGSAEVVAEFPTLASARAAGLSIDAFVLAADSDSSSPSPSPSLAAQDFSPAHTTHAEALTPRERQVLNLVAEGLPNKAIAARLGISDQTVKFHVAAISGKLGASNRTEAVRVAFRRGLVTL